MEQTLLKNLESYIKAHYKPIIEYAKCSESFEISVKSSVINKRKSKPRYASLNISEISLNEFKLDESFSESLLRIIDSKGLKDSDVYKKAHLDRKLFSKIRSNKFYSPSKQTVIALCISLELNLKQTKELLKKAGFALSDSNMFDVIIKFFISQKKYDLYLINEALLQYDQKTII